MFLIDYRNNITLNTGDNGVIDFWLCNDVLEKGDTVTFKTSEQTVVVTSFDKCGIAKINIASYDEPQDTRYCIIVEKKDNRKETVVEGKFIRKGGC